MEYRDRHDSKRMRNTEKKKNTHAVKQRDVSDWNVPTRTRFIRAYSFSYATARTDSEFTHFISRGIRKIKYTREIQNTLHSDKI